MQISSLFVGLALLAATAAYVALPFRQKRGNNLNTAQANVVSKSHHQEILLALRDLDFDFKTGKVSEEDYQPLRAQLLVEAAQYVESEKREEEQLEALIQSRRKTKLQDKCEQCGALMEAGQRFCSKCGASVKNQACPSCGKKIRLGDTFCSSCGTKLEVPMGAVPQS
ncbi:MAG: zinc ribbon domain-containing protein [Byssovorax cruenta]